MPSKKPQKRPPPAKPPTNRIVRWPNRKKKDVRGPWLYGMVLEERPHGPLVQILDFERREAFELTRVNLPWSATIYEMDDSQGLDELVLLTLEGREWQDLSWDNTHTDLMSAGTHALDHLTDETIAVIAAHSLDFCVMYAYVADKYSQLNPLARKDGVDNVTRFYETIIPVAARDHGWWAPLLLLAKATFHRRKSPLTATADYPNAQQTLIERVYLTILTGAQAQRSRYRSMIEGRETWLAMSGDDYVISGMRELWDKGHLRQRQDSMAEAVFPETWEEEVWVKLHPHLMEACAGHPLATCQPILRDHWEQPYFPRLLKALTGAIRGKWQDLEAPQIVAKAVENILERRRAAVASPAFLKMLETALADAKI